MRQSQMLLLKALFHRIAAIFIFKYRSACNYPMRTFTKTSQAQYSHIWTHNTVFNRGKTR